MVEIVFWISFSFVAYVYFGYPLVLLAWSSLSGRANAKTSIEPNVSLVIAAHNERENIEKKIANCLDLDYPREKLQLILSLDGPTDGTEILAWKYAPRGLEIVYSPVHRGKATALNAAVAEARGEIVVFDDARKRLDRRAVRELVANFEDPSVGAATGELVLCDETGKEASDGVGLYWKYEKKIRSLESRIHSLCGATGAIHAIRRELFKPLPEDTILDDLLIRMRVLVGGNRVIFDPCARAYDRVAPVSQSEYSRKLQTWTGTYQLLAIMPELFLPWRNPIYFQFVSHIVGRLLVPYCLVGLFVSNLFVMRGVYWVSLLLQTALYLSALLGFAVTHRPTNLRAPDPLAPTRNKEAA